MDHHLLPRFPTSEEIKVPCVCSPPYYDGDSGSFLVYPHEKGKSWLVLDPWQPGIGSSVGSYEIHHHPPPQELQVFYQQWLFFGFLKEVLEDEFVAETYTDAEGAYITTQSLMSDVERAWSRRLNSREHAEATYKHISNCAKVIFTLVFTMHNKLDFDYSSEFRFDWRIVLSIASSAHVIGASLCHAIHQRYGHLKFITPFKNAVRFPLADTKINMMKAGWCPTEIRTLSGKFFDLQTLVALSRMDRTVLGKDHSQCTEASCKWYKIEPKHYKPQHTIECRGCELFASDKANADVREILIREGSGLPVLKITGAENSLDVQVLETTQDTNYIAISHVWADGMGNYRANSLPKCQLIRLKKWVGDLHTDPRAGTGEICVWIDTLCCPWEASVAKKIAIERLQETYTNARHVLVVDRSLTSLDSRVRPKWELLLWIFCSAWTSRLWTAQEGMLSTSLCFQFEDQALSFQTLWLLLFEEVKQEYRIRSIWSDLINQFKWLQMLRSPQDYAGLFPNNPSHAVFWNLSLALFRRAVTKPYDEPLCICVLMEIPLVRLLSQEKVNEQDNPLCFENRMCRLWKLINDKLEGIPIGVLFFGHSRLKTLGFRWAPKTFLDDFTEINWENIWNFPQTGQLVQNGLLVKSPGFIISQRTWQDGLNRNPLAALPPFIDGMRSTFKDTNSGVFHKIAPPADRPGPVSLHQGPGYSFPESTLLAIVPFKDRLAMPVSSNRSDEAILGRCTDLGNGRHLITEFARICFSKHPHQRNLFYRTAEEIALSARDIPPVRRMNSFTSDQQDTEEFITSKAELKDFYHHAASVKFQDEKIFQAMKQISEKWEVGQLAIAAFDWFWSDYVAESFGEDKEWVID